MGNPNILDAVQNMHLGLDEEVVNLALPNKTSISGRHNVNNTLAIPVHPCLKSHDFGGMLEVCLSLEPSKLRNNKSVANAKQIL